MAWLRDLPPTARHPRPRWQVRYRDEAGRERSAGIYSTREAARAVKRRVERGDFDQDLQGPSLTASDLTEILLAACAGCVRRRPGGGLPLRQVMGC